jgi:hypothetical protein
MGAAPLLPSRPPLPLRCKVDNGRPRTISTAATATAIRVERSPKAAPSPTSNSCACVPRREAHAVMRSSSVLIAIISTAACSPPAESPVVARVEALPARSANAQAPPAPARAKPLLSPLWAPSTELCAFSETLGELGLRLRPAGPPVVVVHETPARIDLPDDATFGSHLSRQGRRPTRGLSRPLYGPRTRRAASSLSQRRCHGLLSRSRRASAPWARAPAPTRQDPSPGAASP